MSERPLLCFFPGHHSTSHQAHDRSCVAICVCVPLLPALCSLWTVARQTPLSMGFPRQDWSGLPFPTLGDLPNPGIKPTSLVSPALAGGFFTTRATWGTCDECGRGMIPTSEELKRPLMAKTNCKTLQC